MFVNVKFTQMKPAHSAPFYFSRRQTEIANEDAVTLRWVSRCKFS